MTFRPARTAELPAVEGVILRAFAGEPFMGWVTGGRPERLRHFVRLAVHEVAGRHGEILVDEGLTAAALLLPPGALPPAPRDALRQLPGLARGAGIPRLALVMRGLLRLERAHPDEPHVTALAGGVVPERQGEGRGSAGLRAIVERAGSPVYLETGSPRTVALYERLGFTVREEIPLPGRGPRIWTMWNGG